MLSGAYNTRIFLHVPATDLRKSFDGLSGLVRSAFGADPCDGSWYLFFNRRRDRVKILYWDRDGLALWYKRLESGTFEALRAVGDSATLELDVTQLTLLLNGVTLASAVRRKRFASGETARLARVQARLVSGRAS
jgi:transposase